MTTTAHTLARLRDLRLNGMATALTQQTEQPGAYEDLPFLDWLALLVDSECLQREQRKQDRLETSDMHAAMAQRRLLQGLRERELLGEPERAEVSGQVGHPQVPEVLEERVTRRPVGHVLTLLRRQAGAMNSSIAPASSPVAIMS